MNLLVTYKAVDMTFYTMLKGLSESSSFTIYVAVSSDKEAGKAKENNCTPLMIPPISSKFSLKVIKALRRIIKQYNMDLIFSPSSAGLSNALLASLGTKAKNVGYRGTQAKVKLTDPTYYLATLNPRVVHTICETEDIYESLSGYIKKEKLSVSTKPFDIAWVADAYQHPKQAEGVPDDAFKCIYVGATKGRPFKGLTYLIEAFQLLNDSNAHLVVVGDYGNGDYKLAKEGVGGERIHFLDRRDDAIYFLPKQDVFILPALRDASPRVVREAMACGVPCIVTDIPGARDLIENNKSGILVPSASPQGIADALQVLIDDKEKRQALGKASRERIMNEFSVSAYVEGFRHLFSSLSR